MDGLNEKEQHIVDLINQLSEMANDEETAQETINGIVGKIRQTTSENISAELKRAEEFKEPERELPPSPQVSNDVLKNDDAKRDEDDEDIDFGPGTLSFGSQRGNFDTSPASSDKLFFTRIREVQKPGKAHPTDAGIDFYVPDAKAWDSEFRENVFKFSRNFLADSIVFTDNSIIVKPNAHIAIPSGIKTIIPVGYGMMMVNKSGIATKMKLDHSACLIDSEYRDELIFCFFNHNTEPIEITPGMKITQGLIVPIINLQVQEVLNCVYDDLGKSTDRGGGFGSSGS